MGPAVLLTPWLMSFSARTYIKRFRNPHLRRLLEAVVDPEINALSLIYTLSSFTSGDSGYPEGGSLRMAQNMADTFVSLGGQILLEMLSQRADLCSYALVESAAVLPSRLTNALIGPAFGASFGLIQNRSFAKMQFQSLHIKPELFEDYYRDTCRIKKQDMIAFMKANTSYALKDPFRDTRAKVHVYVGEKETSEILRSAEAICRALPSARLHPLPGLRHGEFSLNQAPQYADAIRKIVCT